MGSSNIKKPILTFYHLKIAEPCFFIVMFNIPEKTRANFQFHTIFYAIVIENPILLTRGFANENQKNLFSFPLPQICEVKIIKITCC